ncbi:MAG: hypothetical protein HY735_01465 [Verrucomicrobia bacterium]|nr:hypothetical protein [Verrucomicrobiota bacterium]
MAKHDSPAKRTAQINRRHFIAGSALASLRLSEPVSGAESPALNGALPADRRPVAPSSKGTMPAGRIGKLTISRLISGGNLISGWAHSRDLHYVPSLMRAYNTEEKVMDTLQLMEERGVNAIIADPRKKPMDIFQRYWKERGGRIQWIAEGHPDLADWKTNVRESVDFGASAVYVQGVIGDRWLNAGRIDLLGQCVDFIKSLGVPGGIGAHKLEVIMESEKRRFGAEFYVKTLHHGNYWSARRPDQVLDVVQNRADNYWDMSPEKTIAFMQEVEKPWIAFKVLAAGAIRAESGIRYAFQNGADFVCVGMFDFQVEENVSLVKRIVPETQNRERAWLA